MSLKSARTSRGIVHLIPVLVVALIVFIGLTAISYLRDQGLVSGQGSLVLGDEDEVEEEEDDASEVEIKNVGTTTQVRTEEKVEYHQNGQRVKLEIEDGRTKIKIEDREGSEDEDDFELEMEEEVEITGSREAKLKVRIENNKFVIKTNQIEARTNFPLSVDLATNELIVNTPAGERRVTILPDRAVANMLGQNAVNRITETRLETLSSGQVVYEVEGVEDQKLLGLVDVEIQKTGIVLGDTGEVTEIQQDIISQVLDLLSI